MAATTSRTGEAARNLGERGADFFSQIGTWIADNSADLAIATAAGIVIALLLLGARRFGHHLIRDRDVAISWRSIFGRVLAKTSLFFIVMCAAKIVSGQANTPAALQRVIDITFIVAAAFQAAVWGRELILGFIQQRIGSEEEQSRLGSAIGIIRLLVTVALFAIAIVLILDNVGVNVTGLVAGLGIGGIAIGLAAQGIFSDLFAALSIIFDRPFRRGDTISFGSPLTTGTVEQIGLKSTRVRSLSGEEVVIANTKLLEQQLQNWALLKRRRVVLQFGIIYQTPPELLARIPMEIKEIVEAQPLATFDRCHAFQFAPSSIDFELVYFVESSDMNDHMATRQAVMLGMLRRFQDLGVEFAYPTQTTFTAAPDGRMVMPYPDMKMMVAPLCEDDGGGRA